MRKFLKAVGVALIVIPTTLGMVLMWFNMVTSRSLIHGDPVVATITLYFTACVGLLALLAAGMVD